MDPNVWDPNVRYGNGYVFCAEEDGGPRPRPGYEYRHQFQADDGRNTDRKRVKLWSTLSQEYWALDFKIRTNFILVARGGGETVLCSESFTENCEGYELLIPLLWGVTHRLREYWMPEVEIEEIVREAYDLVRSSDVSTGPRVIPFTLTVDVCTVQREGEELGAAMDRAIRVENLTPVKLFDYDSRLGDIDIGLRRFFVATMKRKRLEDADLELGLMRFNCSICGRSPTLGANISTIDCGHTFHYHCIVGWLCKKNSCPACNVPAYNIEEPGLGRDRPVFQYHRIERRIEEWERMFPLLWFVNPSTSQKPTNFN